MTDVATIIARLVDEIPPGRSKILVIDLMTGTTSARRPGRKAKPKVDAGLTARPAFPRAVALKSRPGTQAGNQDRAAACRRPARPPWRLRTRYWPSAE